jgi:hypothetical protein
MTALQRLCLALATLSLTGCASASDDPGDLNYNSEVASQIDAQNLKGSQHNRCIVLGADPGTDAYDRCLDNLATSDAQIGTASERARMQSRRNNAAGSQPVSCKTTIVRAMPKTECF